jgi:uric acid transporter
MGLMPRLGAVIAALPGPVLGGIGVVMFGTVGAIGLKIAAQADLANPRNMLIIAISFGFGLMPTGAPQFYSHLPVAAQTVLGSGIAAGGISAIVLNLLLNHTWGPQDERPAEPVAAEPDEHAIAGHPLALEP